MGTPMQDAAAEDASNAQMEVEVEVEAAVLEGEEKREGAKQEGMGASAARSLRSAAAAAGVASGATMLAAAAKRRRGA